MSKILIAGALLLGFLVPFTGVLPAPGVALAAQPGDDGKADRTAAASGSAESSEEQERVNKSNDQWRRELTPDQFAVTRCSATEAPFSGKYNDHHEKGIYNCVCCGNELFSSSAKYDSGSGWPSYFQPASAGAVTERKDLGSGMVRVEIVCSRCDAHLGHVFRDGPQPTGLRYCINSAALNFVPAQQEDTPPATD